MFVKYLLLNNSVTVRPNFTINVPIDFGRQAGKYAVINKTPNIMLGKRRRNFLELPPKKIFNQ
jgi:hypothetical protein